MKISRFFKAGTAMAVMLLAAITAQAADQTVDITGMAAATIRTDILNAIRNAGQGGTVTVTGTAATTSNISLQQSDVTGFTVIWTATLTSTTTLAAVSFHSNGTYKVEAGGSITNTNGGANARAINATYGSTVIINGGTVTSNATSSTSGTIVADDNSTILLLAGTVENQSTTGHAIYGDHANSKVSLLGGTAKAVGNAPAVYIYSGAVFAGGATITVPSGIPTISIRDGEAIKIERSNPSSNTHTQGASTDLTVIGGTALWDIAGDGKHGVSYTISNSGQTTGFFEVPGVTVNEAPTAPGQFNVNDVSAITANSITIKTAANMEYGISATTTAPAVGATGQHGWTAHDPATSTVTFTNLASNTDYYIFVRQSGNPPSQPSVASAAVKTNMAVLGGTVRIDGIPAAGRTLTANLNSLTPAAAQRGTTTIEWLGDGVQIAQTVHPTVTYVVQPADVGKTISVKVTAANATGAVTSEGVLAVGAMGQFNMTGGKIIDNTGGGVTTFTDGSNIPIFIGGTAVISGNVDGTSVPSNLRLRNNGYLTISEPQAGMSVGITKADNDGVFVQSGASADHAQYFFADQNNYGVVHSAGALQVKTSADITNVLSAKSAIEAPGVFPAVAQATLNTQEAAKANVGEIIGSIAANDVIWSITGESFTAAQAGTFATPEGVNGAYTFKVALSKGEYNIATAEITLTITATVYVPDWGDWVTTLEPTCTAKGSRTRTCQRDPSNTETEEIAIDPDNHALADVSAVAATCVLGGNTAGVRCTRSGCTHNTTTPIAALGHSMPTDWTLGSIITAATCQAAGSQNISKTCTRATCNHTESSTQAIAIDPTAHALADVSAVAATCTVGGNIAGQKCTRNGCTHNTATATNALGHAWNSLYTIITDATCNSSGSEAQFCTRTGCTQHHTPRDIPKLTVGCNSTASDDRVIPVTPPDNSAVVIAPINVTAFEITVGPNPVRGVDGGVNIFVTGKRVDDGTLTIYDVTGNVINKITIRDNAVIGNIGRRVVGSWDLKDAKGNHVSAGSYLLRGTVKTTDGKRERVSIIIGVK